MKLNPFQISMNVPIPKASISEYPEKQQSNPSNEIKRDPLYCFVLLWYWLNWQILALLQFPFYPVFIYLHEAKMLMSKSICGKVIKKNRFANKAAMKFAMSVLQYFPGIVCRICRHLAQRNSIEPLTNTCWAQITIMSYFPTNIWSSLIGKYGVSDTLVHYCFIQRFMAAIFLSAGYKLFICFFSFISTFVPSFFYFLYS